MLEQFTLQFKDTICEVARRTEIPERLIAERGLQLLQKAGVDPIQTSRADAWIAFLAASDDKAFARSLKFVTHLAAFGDLRTALVAAGAI